MLARDLYELRTVLQNSGIIFAYSGYVSESILSGVGSALKQKMLVTDVDTQTIRSVFAVFVEQMQNIIRYSAESLEVVPRGRARALDDDSQTLRYGVLTVGQSGELYVVHAGNLIAVSDTERLRERLQAVKAMDRAQLKAEYKELLRSGPDEYSKGAGIGFIEIARRASQPIEFDFAGVDENYAFFALKALI